MVMKSCSVTLICVTVRVACVPPVRRDFPPTLALDRKSESHCALSPGSKGGISADGAAGSNVRLAKVTGCLLIVGTGASLICGCDEAPRHASQPKMSAPSNTQSTTKRLEGNTASAFHSPNKTPPEP